MVEVQTAPSGEVKVVRVTAQETAHRLHEKYYGNKSKVTKENDKIAKHVIADSKGPSRNDLMMTAKSKGIKNYRILNKEELAKVLEMKQSGATDEQMNDQVIRPAVERWKSGWKKNKEVNNG